MWLDALLNFFSLWLSVLICYCFIGEEVAVNRVERDETKQDNTSKL